ncbi:MAG: class I SAM-dependent rRNA methyltransferase [Saprospiraceae bacterium]|nr:class I SAM-dependent rRNA methyltransferase [Saprospiraceae bacterium]
MKADTYPVITVKNDRLASIKRRHPWIFSKGTLEKEPVEDGDVVTIKGSDGSVLATGHYHDSSIAIRILSFRDCLIDQAFWQDQISKCKDSRTLLNLPNAETNTYRLVNGEGDHLSGLIIDIYANLAVIQCHTIGMFRAVGSIAKALTTLLGEDLMIYNKSKSTLPPNHGGQIEDGFIKGNCTRITILEHGHKFYIDPINGQKTGFFIDQRENRKLLGSFAEGRNILNLYSYTGGFSIYALNQGANYVCSVDTSAPALEFLEEILILNNHHERHDGLIGDVKKVLPSIKDEYYDIIIVDPPAFAKSKFKSNNAVQAYKRINTLAIAKVRSGGLIFTFSCSQVIDQQLFANTITAAAIEAQREVRILHFLSQAPDHPVNIFHPEGKYLKGLVLEVK